MPCHISSELSEVLDARANSDLITPTCRIEPLITLGLPQCLVDSCALALFLSRSSAEYPLFLSPQLIVS